MVYIVMDVIASAYRNEAIVKSSVETADYYYHSYASLIVITQVPV